MAVEEKNIGEIYADHALAEHETDVPNISIPRIQEQRDMVYPGTINMPDIESAYSQQGAPALPNVKRKRQKFSPFIVILILLAAAVISVFYIGNILAVGRLMVQNDKLQIKHRQILDEQELLKSRINRLSGLERIQKLANEQLGLKNPKRLPVWIEIDPERINQIQEAIGQQADQKR